MKVLVEAQALVVRRKGGWSCGLRMIDGDGVEDNVLDETYKTRKEAQLHADEILAEFEAQHVASGGVVIKEDPRGSLGSDDG